jgi:hypothetical protein
LLRRSHPDGVMHPRRGCVSARSCTAWEGPAVRERRGRATVREGARVHARTTEPEADVEMTALHIPHPSQDQRAEHGRQARERTPLDSHTGWRPAADRADRGEHLGYRAALRTDLRSPHESGCGCSSRWRPAVRPGGHAGRGDGGASRRTGARAGAVGGARGLGAARRFKIKSGSSLTQ